jgi:hypothetical protein
LSVWIYCAVDGICVEHVCLIPCLATEVWQTVTTVHTAVGAVLHSLTCGLGVVTSGQGQYSTVRLAVGMKIPSPSCPPSVRNSCTWVGYFKGHTTTSLQILLQQETAYFGNVARPSQT